MIESLNEDGFIRGLYNDIIKRRCEFQDLKCEYISVDSATEFIQIIEKINQEILEAKIFPHIHLEMHGSEDGLKFKGSQIRLTWEIISNQLKKVNGLCGNNLVVTMAVCFGSYFSIELLKSLNEGESSRSPALFIIGPKEEISQGKLQEGFHYFFDDFLMSRNLGDAYNSLLSNANLENDFRMVSCEDMFESLFMSLVKNWINEDLSNESKVQYRFQRIISNYFIDKRRRPNRNEKKEIFQRMISEDFYQEFINEHRHSYFWIDKFPENDKRFGRVEIKNWNRAIYERYNEMIK